MKINLIIAIAISITQLAMGQTCIQGAVKSQIDSLPIVFATVALYDDSNTLVNGLETDFDGNYQFIDIDPGAYDVEVSNIGFRIHRITGVIVNNNQLTKLEHLILKSKDAIYDPEVIEYKAPLIPHQYTGKRSITALDIRNLPVIDFSALNDTTNNNNPTNNSDISIGPGRSNSTVYYIDGKRVDVRDKKKFRPFNFLRKKKHKKKLNCFTSKYSNSASTHHKKKTS